MRPVTTPSADLDEPARPVALGGEPHDEVARQADVREPALERVVKLRVVVCGFEEIKPLAARRESRVGSYSSFSVVNPDTDTPS